MEALYIILGIIEWLVCLCIAIYVTKNRYDNTPLIEVLLLSLFLTPILAIFLEMLKPYHYYGKQPKKEKELSAPKENKESETVIPTKKDSISNKEADKRMEELYGK